MINLVFLGDISLNGIYEQSFKKGIKPFEKLGDELKRVVVVGNLECFARGSQGVNEHKKPRLATSLDTLYYLKDFNLQIACLANNHVYDHLDDGFLKTSELLKTFQIKTLGASLNKAKAKESLIIEEDDIKIALLNYVTKDTNPNPPLGTKICVNFFNLESALEDIKKIRKTVDHIVLIMHWGGKVEGGLFPDYDQPKIARKLIDGGVDLIIGHHSHTIQPFEKYNNKYIFYSIGNFCFSDFIFEGINHVMPKRRKNVCIPKITFNKTHYRIENSFWYNHGLHYSKKPLIKYQLILNNFLLKIFRYKIIWSLYYLHHKMLSPIKFYLLRKDMSFNQKIRNINWLKIKRFLIKK
jgi:hypothetical protein